MLTKSIRQLKYHQFWIKKYLLIYSGCSFLSLTGFKLNKLIVNDAFLGLAHYKAGGEGSEIARQAIFGYKGRKEVYA